MGDLLTVDRFTVGADVPAGISTMQGADAACHCPEGCDLEIEHVGRVQFVFGGTKSGTCATIAYRIRSPVAGLTHGQKDLLAFDLFKMKPNEVQAKFGSQYSISPKNTAELATAYCYPYTGKYDGLDWFGEPVHVVLIRMWTESASRVDFLLVELAGSCPEDPFPPVPVRD